MIIITKILKVIFGAIIAFFAFFGGILLAALLKFDFSKRGQEIWNDRTLCDKCRASKVVKEFFKDLSDSFDI